MSRRAENGRAYLVIATIAILGLASTLYILANQGQGVSSPWEHVYKVRAELRSANGVVPGIGQPVNVAGVEVGSIIDAEPNDAGNAVVTLEIDRDQLPRVYTDASAILRPITPLKDMRIELDPGRPPAPALPRNGLITVANTSTSADLSEVLSALDADTRRFLTTFLASLDTGTEGQGMNMRRMLRTLGPTTAQARKITAELAGRRTELARLVHNLGDVMKASTRDRQLATVVEAGNRTLAAVASQEEPVREAIAKLPGTLSSTRQTLDHTATFADKLGPTLTALEPGVERLPGTLKVLRPFSDLTADVLKRDVNPLLKEIQPLAGDLGPVVAGLNRIAPDAAQALQFTTYLSNVLGYNPPGSDEGGLFWAAWWAHNWLTTWDTSDAHGILARATIVESCQNRTSELDSAIQAIVKSAMGLQSLCPVK